MGRGRRALYHLWGDGLFGCLLYRYRPARLDRPESGTIAKVLVRSLQCCGSGMFIPDPGSRIQKQQQKRGVKKNSQNWILFYFWNAEEKEFGQIFKELFKFLPKKCSLCSLIYGFGIRDPGSEIRDPEKTYSGSRSQGSKRHWIPDPGSGTVTLVINRYML